ncbi:glycosyltransferase family 2 protein [Lacinutrix neustonica]|uniref:glycosyltransferase family 2 protein n=1 Tax=Lacinutrix neustonica TaxID=2980107 RepID=UPI0028BDCFB3|nr:glycosyltransferase family 2 protein [Lacinutrix neustonica]
MKALVSIITPLYNSEAFITLTINSVLNQTYPHWELWLIDDGSTDDTIKIAESFTRKHPNVYLLKNKTNVGAAKAVK